MVGSFLPFTVLWLLFFIGSAAPAASASQSAKKGNSRRGMEESC